MDKKVKITDTILRDAHQSQIATRMSIEEMLPVLETLDNSGFHSLEVWGGATFDACLRFLEEDPWERLRTIRKHVKNTKLQMLLRGQNLLGYKHYDDSVVDLFIKKSIENGIDIIRCFDALNDLRNLKTATDSIVKYGGHAQLALCFTISDVHTDSYYASLAKSMQEMGAHSICIKDMAGILTPQRAYNLVKAIKEVTALPLHLHTHATSGVSEMTYLKAIEAGVDCIDTANSSFAGGTSQPSTESMVLALKEMGYLVDIDLEKCSEVSSHFKPIKENFNKRGIFDYKVMETDPMTLLYQVPGGMISNLLSQLKEANQSDKFMDVLREIPKVREELGYPPLVTPLSQMVGTQAVMNIISQERYKLVPKEVKEYVLGSYGKSPAPIKEEIYEIMKIDKSLINHERPADSIVFDMDSVREELGEICESDEDLLSYILFPQIVLPILKKRHDPFYDIPVQFVTVTL